MPALVILLLVNIYPLIYSFYYSFTDFSLIKSDTVRFVGFSNYKNLFGSKEYLKSMLTTSKFVIVAVTLEVLIGVALALLLHELKKFGHALLSFFLLPMMLTPVIVGIMWRLLYNFDFGMINFFIEEIGFDRIAFLANPQNTIYYLSLVDVWQWSPYVMLLTYSSLQSLPISYLEAAKIDGASKIQVLTHIYLPYISSTLTICILIRLMDTIREYDKVFTMTMGGPGNSTETASYFIYRKSFKFFDTSSAFAASFILLVITIVLANLFFRRMKNEK